MAPASHQNTMHNCVIVTEGLGRSKYVPRPLPQEINVLLSECELNCYYDGSEKSTLAAPSPPLATTQMLTTAATSSRTVDTYDEDDDDDNRIG